MGIRIVLFFLRHTLAVCAERLWWLQVRLVGVQKILQEGDPTWAESLTKLSVF